MGSTPFLLGAYGKVAQSPWFQHRAKMVRQSSFSLSEGCFCIYASEGGGATSLYELPDRRGLIFGKIFQNNTAVEVTPSYLKNLGGDSIPRCKEFWGKYVGVSFDKKNQSLTLFRDPMGLSTVFYIQTSEGLIFSTELSLLHDLLEEKPSIDWEFFIEHILDKNQALTRTPLKGVKELLPGMALSMDQRQESSLKHFWDISEITFECIRNKEDFELQLLETLKISVQAWGQSSKGICVELSGGTDSSGVLLLLKEIFQEKKIIAVNYFDSGQPSSNEIEFAKEVAEHCSLPLFLLDINKDSWIDPLPSTWRPNRPWGCLHSSHRIEKFNDFLKNHDCDLMMNGQGGDHVFLSPPPEKALVDLWLSRKWTLFPKVFSELSSINRMPWGALLQNTVNSLIHRRPKEELSITPTSPYIHPDCLKKLSPNPFYLEQKLSGLPPAKAEQIKGLFHALAYAERDETAIGCSYSHPLLSQPLVEMALKIPTYQSFGKGFDRLFFRSAVSRIHNSSALWRRTKGGTSSSVVATLNAHLGGIQEVIFQGSLAKNGVIDTEVVEEAITKIRHGQLESLWPILHILESQKWLGQWGR